MDRITRPEGENRQHRLYYLTPVSEAPSSMGNIFVIKPVCNLRSAPTTESSLVGRVRQCQSLEALERDGDWFWVVTSDGTRGWIHSMLVTTLDHRMPE